MKRDGKLELPDIGTRVVMEAGEGRVINLFPVRGSVEVVFRTGERVEVGLEAFNEARRTPEGAFRVDEDAAAVNEEVVENGHSEGADQNGRSAAVGEKVSAQPKSTPKRRPRRSGSRGGKSRARRESVPGQEHGRDASERERTSNPSSKSSKRSSQRGGGGNRRRRHRRSKRSSGGSSGGSAGQSGSSGPSGTRGSEDR